MSNLERGKGFFNGRINRRRMILGSTGLGLGLGISASKGIGPSEAFHALEIGYEYGPDVAQAVISHPEQSLEAYRLWKRPERSYLKKPFFGEKLMYKKNASNGIVGFGDSNLEGADGDGSKWRQSPVHLFRTLAQKTMGFEDWKDFNCAKSGSTTEMIMSQQVDSDKAKEGFNFSPKCDVWINAGGNDASNLVQNEDEVEELNRLAEDPFNHMSLLLKYTGRIERNIDKFGDNFLDLLRAVQTPYGSKIRQFIIMSAPDFGKVDSIETQEISGQARYIRIGNSAIRRLIENISIRMNNKMFDAAEQFQLQTGSRIVGIDTATPQISEFSKDQHFSEQACEEIAHQALARIDLIAV